jgi:hypothetical protein
MELIGTKPISRLLVSSSNTPEVRLLSSTSITWLQQYYEPVRHPTRLSLLLTEFSLRATTSHRMGFPVFRSISSSRHADAITPTEPLGAVAISPSGIGLPHNSDGSASATSLFGACSAFTHVSACLFARSPKVTFTRVLQRICYLLRRSGCFRPSDQLAG